MPEGLLAAVLELVQIGQQVAAGGLHQVGNRFPGPEGLSGPQAHVGLQAGQVPLQQLLYRTPVAPLGAGHQAGFLCARIAGHPLQS